MTSRESNDDTAFDSCFCLQIYKLFSIRLHFQYKKLESSLKTMAADPFPDRLPQSREWDSNPRPFRYEIKTTNYNILIISVMNNAARIDLHGCCTDF